MHFFLLAVAVACSSLYAGVCEEALTADQLAVLKKADTSGDYLLRVMDGAVNGQPRLVVFLGESHRKSAEASALGKEVLAQFENRGVEGANLGAYWIGRPLRWTLKVMDWVGPWLLGLKDHVKGSTIEDAVETQGTAYWLEHDHRPTVRENLLATLFPAGMGYCLVKMGHTLLASSASLVASGGTDTQAYVSLGTLVGTVWFMNWALKRGFNPFRPVFWAIEQYFDHAFGRGRNQTMVRNIVAVFKKYEEVPVMLVIVGRSHVDGMAKLLEEQHGFKTVETPKDAPDTTSCE